MLDRVYLVRWDEFVQHLTNVLGLIYRDRAVVVLVNRHAQEVAYFAQVLAIESVRVGI